MISTKFPPGSTIRYEINGAVGVGIVMPYHLVEERDATLRSDGLRIWAYWDKAGHIGYVPEEYGILVRLPKPKRNLPDWF
jgi:hypothetical protein